jgi:hypothetical protein
MRAIFALILSCFVLGALAQDRPARSSCRAEVFVPESLKQEPSIVSPDGKFRLVLGNYLEGRDSDSGALRVFHGKTLLGKYELRDLSAGIFVKWSPDSLSFYVMWSNGGMIGGYEVRVFRVSSNEVREIFPTRLAVEEFTRKHDCEVRGLNVFAIRWMGSSERLEIAAQVYPTSDCGKEMGFTTGYTVQLDDGAILERISQEKMEKEMKQCPTLIWPTGLWSGDDLQKAKASVLASQR